MLCYWFAAPFVQFLNPNPVQVHLLGKAHDALHLRANIFEETLPLIETVNVIQQFYQLI